MINIINLARLSGGELINEPSVSVVEGFAYKSEGVKSKFAFIDINGDESEIQKAIELGAYAIIFSGDCEIKNSEIALIRVANLNQALTRLIVFFANSKNHKFVRTNLIQNEILKRFVLPKSVLFAPQNLHEFLVILTGSEDEKIFFCNDGEILEKFGSKLLKITPNSDYEMLFLGSIFFSNFIFDEVYYQNLPLPRIFIDEFCGIVEFLKEQNINYKIGDLRNLEHFEPVFVDRFFRICKFGESYRAFICESDETLFVKAASFLTKEFSQNIVISLPWSKEIKGIDADFRYNRLENLKNIKDFHYALVNCDKNSLLEMLNSHKIQNSLF